MGGRSTGLQGERPSEGMHQQLSWSSGPLDDDTHTNDLINLITLLVLLLRGMFSLFRTWLNAHQDAVSLFTE
jgi:hypothetical protein